MSGGARNERKLRPQLQRQEAAARAALQQPASPLWVPAAAGGHFAAALRRCGSGGLPPGQAADARWQATESGPSTPAGPSASPLLPRPASDPSSLPSCPQSPGGRRAAAEAEAVSSRPSQPEPPSALPASELRLLPPLPCMLEKPRRPHSALVKRALEMLEAPLKPPPRDCPTVEELLELNEAMGMSLRGASRAGRRWPGGSLADATQHKRRRLAPVAASRQPGPGSAAGQAASLGGSAR